jgi:hypothetical protein
MTKPRIALFSDSHHEVVEASAKRLNIPLLSVHVGRETRLVRDGSITHLDLKLRKFCTMNWFLISCVAENLAWFAPDMVCVADHGSIARMGSYLARRRAIPICDGIPPMGSLTMPVARPVPRRMTAHPITMFALKVSSRNR